MAVVNSIEELEKLLEGDSMVKVAGIDVDGVFRGKVMAKSKFISAAKAGFGFCSVIFGWDMHDVVYQPELNVSNLSNGYRDIIAQIDLSTYRRIPWENNIPFFLVTFHDPDTQVPLTPCPRSLLARQVELFRSKLGLQPLSGFEFEFFQFKETPESLQKKQGTDLTVLSPGMHGYSLLRTTDNQDYFYALWTELEKFDVPVEGLHTETGPGVYEAALMYSNSEVMADRAALFKLSAKQIAKQYGIMPTFMAKPHNGMPGCSG